jgi:serine/threonine protein kinase
MVDTAPKRYNQYELVEKLKTGGEAEVWRAKDSGTEKEIVIRILKGHEDTQGGRRRLQREVKHLKELDGGPHIIPLLDAGWAHGEPYVIMPYIPGGSLEDALKDKSKWPSLDQSIVYIQQATEALIYAHNHRIIHRDVKPANLLLLDENEILLSDFGIAINADIPPLTRKDWGTDPYCPQEQRDGKPVPASDQYALAVTMCRLLTKKLPNEGGKEDLQRDYPEIAKVFMRAYSDEHTKRYPSMKDFASALKQAAESDLPTIPVKTPGKPEPSLRRPMQCISLAQLAGALLVLSVVMCSCTWIIRGIVDRQSPIFPSPSVTTTPSTCSQTITTLDDGGSGSLRQVLHDLPQGPSCLLSFASPLRGDLVLTKMLQINRNVIIAAQNKNLIYINPKTYQVTIVIEPRYKVTFQNISFRGSNDNIPRFSAFIQSNSADVRLVSCDMSGFSSYSNGSALSNEYGNLTLEDTTIQHNQATDEGGAIYNLGLSSIGKGTLTLIHSIISDNHTFYRGGGIDNLGGQLLLLNQSQMTDNYTTYSGGGGAVASVDGTIFVSDSTISSNHAYGSGDGGGLLLIGANAQIVSSIIRDNTADTPRGGGVAVESNPDNSRLSYLDLSDTSFQGNSANQSFQSPQNDIWGNIIFKDQNMGTRIIASIATSSIPASMNQVGSSLTIDQFSTFCQTLQDNQGRNFIAAAPASAEGGGIVCVGQAPDNKTDTLANLLHQSVQQAVQSVCQHIYRDQMKSAKNVLARLLNYRDPLTWQCFKNEQQLKWGEDQQNLRTNVTQNDFNNHYCQSQHPGSTAMLQEQSEKTAYDWKCMLDSNPYGISVDQTCQSISGNSNAIGLLDPSKFADPNSWQCWEPIVSVN